MAQHKKNFACVDPPGAVSLVLCATSSRPILDMLEDDMESLECRLAPVSDTESYLDLQQCYQAYKKVIKLEIHTVLVLLRPYNQGTYGRSSGMARRPLTV